MHLFDSTLLEQLSDGRIALTDLVTLESMVLTPPAILAHVPLDEAGTIAYVAGSETGVEPGLYVGTRGSGPARGS